MQVSVDPTKNGYVVNLVQVVSRLSPGTLGKPFLKAGAWQGGAGGAQGIEATWSGSKCVCEISYMPSLTDITEKTSGGDSKCKKQLYGLQVFEREGRAGIIVREEFEGISIFSVESL